MRSSGILLPVSALPGRGGCGTMGESARRFVDFLESAGQGWWQLLPLNPPARGNSPYSSHSVFAGNPALIDLDRLARKGLLSKKELEELPPGTATADYAWCAGPHLALLRKSFARTGDRDLPGWDRFQSLHHFWLEDYALFMALKTRYRGADYRTWPDPVRTRQPGALASARKGLAEEIRFWEYVQYLFFRQWRSLKAYANHRGVRLFGDMPFYVDGDSADVWANPQVFALDRDRRSSKVAGVPPDAFSDDGQLWGNPLYNWTHLRMTGFQWWVRRLGVAGHLYDSVRIDHFRALAQYWAVPAGSATARSGCWEKGPGMDFIKAVRKALPGLDLVAEDLGLLDDGVRRLHKKSGLPGMKVLLFAFDPKEESSYLPHNFKRNCVGYIGTHDNDTVQGWLETAPPLHVRYAQRYLDIADLSEAHWAMIRTLWASVADRVIVQMQDVLGLGDDARTNRPGTPEGNWTWRLLPGQMDTALAARLRELTLLYGRLGA